ncbi:twin-arginine translocation pathway signal protein [Actinophytocola sp.]|uniref:dioxygenase family protein n=1 Tax=Actinophytocola sp. TaxID=1872138 RepID=UPI002ED2ECA9
MHDDDEPVGRVLGRRQALAILGMSGMALTVAGVGVAGAASASSTTNADTVDIVVKPEMTEGPYFVDENLNRSDIRVDTSDGSVVDGTALRLNLRIMSVASTGAVPIKGAQVDVWHCDAFGVYSDVAAEGTVGKKYLRGYQLTNGDGKVQFLTILPGWYQGRAIHIHVKVRTTGTDGNPYEFTSQLFFTEEFKTAYLATQPYASKGTPDTTNSTDMWYATGGDQMVLSPKTTDEGLKADFTIGMDLSDTAVGASDSFSAGGGGGGTPPGDGVPPGDGTPPPA